MTGHISGVAAELLRPRATARFTFDERGTPRSAAYLNSAAPLTPCVISRAGLLWLRSCLGWRTLAELSCLQHRPTERGQIALQITSHSGKFSAVNHRLGSYVIAWHAFPKDRRVAAKDWGDRHCTSK